MSSFKFYEVGGKIRDELLGLQSKDVDYVAVPNEDVLAIGSAKLAFLLLHEELIESGFEIFLFTPECYTIRARFPKGHRYEGVADFVMARKEVGYIPGTRTPIVELGNLYDDLSRRDFTVNALAKDPDTGEIIDYFNGLKDLKERKLTTPLDTLSSLDDDPLRILRAIRFCITRDLYLSAELWDTIDIYDYESKMSVVSTDRIREELHKCFKCNTLETLWYLENFRTLSEYIFTRTNLWLKPTNEL